MTNILLPEVLSPQQPTPFVWSRASKKQRSYDQCHKSVQRNKKELLTYLLVLSFCSPAPWNSSQWIPIATASDPSAVLPPGPHLHPVFHLNPMACLAVSALPHVTSGFAVRFLATAYAFGMRRGVPIAQRCSISSDCLTRPSPWRHLVFRMNWMTRLTGSALSCLTSGFGVRLAFSRFLL